jgi:hypothetical protein
MQRENRLSLDVFLSAGYFLALFRQIGGNHVQMPKIPGASSKWSLRSVKVHLPYRQGSPMGKGIIPHDGKRCCLSGSYLTPTSWREIPW